MGVNQVFSNRLMRAWAQPLLIGLLTCGFVTLPAGDQTIRVKAEKIPGKQLMALNRLWLKRID